MAVFEKRSQFAVPVGDLFEWHEAPGAFKRLRPPWQDVELIECSDGIRSGSKVVIRVAQGPIKQTWEMVHEGYKKNALFCDRMVSGPFSHWLHEHRFEAINASESALTERINYHLPVRPIGNILGQPFFDAMMQKLFRYRHTITEMDLVSHKPKFDLKPMKIAITGATGLVGDALIPYLEMQGHSVMGISRSDREGFLRWDVNEGPVSADKLEGVDVVIHLAGENVGSRWTRARKRAISESRVNGTRHLVESMLAMKNPPKVLISSSGIGYYGYQKSFPVDESSKRGDGFLADVCEQWEAATQPAKEAGIRVVNLRTGVVLSPAGGALAKMLPAFKAGIAGPLGDGKQKMSWVAIDDLVDIIYFCVGNDALSGPVNAVSPRVVTNAEFTKTLGSVLNRPTVLPFPEFVARGVFGEMAKETIFSDLEVVPKKLMDADYSYRFAGLSKALKHLL